jgi:hypothetical protein
MLEEAKMDSATDDDIHRLRGVCIGVSAICHRSILDYLIQYLYYIFSYTYK